MDFEWKEKDGELKPFYKNKRGEVIDVAWAPMPGSQQAFLECPLYEVLYEGTRGPGKTDALLMDFGQHVNQGYGAEWRGILFRQSYPQLSDIVAKTKKWFYRIWPDNAVFNEQKMTWTWNTGEQLLLRHMAKEEDYWSYHGHCVDEGEVLTHEGWKDIGDIAVGEYILSCDLTTNTSCWARVDTTTKQKYIGDLVRYEGRGRYMSFTPEHRLVTADNHRTAYRRLPRNAKLKNAGWDWHGQPIKEIIIPEAERYHGGGTKDPNPLKLSGDDFCELMGWFLSEGWVLSNKYPNRVGIAQIKKLNCEKIYQLLKRIGFKCQYSNGSFYWQSKSWRKFLKQFGKSRDKFILSIIKNASKKQLRLFFEAFIDGDGTRQENCCYAYTISEQLSEDLCEIGIKLGYAVYKTKTQKPNRCGLLYTIGFNPKECLNLYTDNRQRNIIQKSSKTQIHRVSHDGFVYCLGIKSTHTFFIRQRGSVWLSSNSYPWIGWEEITTWPDPICYKRMMSCSRSTNPRMPRKYRSTTNPYGVGHNWVKARWNLRTLTGKQILHKIIRPENEPERVAVRGYLFENIVLLHADPTYVQKIIAAARNPAEMEAWINGSWDIVAGGMFDDVWNPAKHIVPNFEVPHSWKVNRSFDWGSSKPFSVGWWAESDGTDVVIRGKRYSTIRGDLFRISEWYGWTGQPNEGLRMIAREIAQGILERERRLFPNRMVTGGPADSSIYDKVNNNSIADDMSQVGVYWEKADKSPGSRKLGWEKMRSLFKAGLDKPREEPSLYICTDCDNFLRTIPVLPRSDRDLDDINTDAEDHIADETRYRVFTRSEHISIKGVRGR